MKCSYRGPGAGGRGLALPALMISFLTLLMGWSSVAPSAAQGPGHPRLKLNLSSEQRDKLHKHIRQTRERSEELRADLQAVRVELFNQLRQYKLNQPKVNEILKRHNGIQLARLKNQLDSQIKIRKILTKEQFQEVRETLATQEGRHGRKRDYGVKPAVIDKLGLSSDQRTRIDRLYKASRERSRSIAEKLRSDTDALQQLYKNYDLDPRQATSIIDRLIHDRLDLQRSMLSRQIELRKILNEEQFKEVVKTMRPWGQGRDGARGERGGMPPLGREER